MSEVYIDQDGHLVRLERLATGRIYIARHFGDGVRRMLATSTEATTEQAEEFLRRTAERNGWKQQ